MNQTIVTRGVGAHAVWSPLSGACGAAGGPSPPPPRARARGAAAPMVWNVKWPMRGMRGILSLEEKDAADGPCTRRRRARPMNIRGRTLIHRIHVFYI
jgi:hypothetical protein